MPPHDRIPVAAAADAVLGQCADFVRDLPDDAYVGDATTIRGGTIGKHVRHCLDHFSAALCAIDGATIDYDTRCREVPVEHDRDAALQGIGAVRRQLAGLAEDQLGAGVRVRVMLSADGAGTELESTLARELAFATHHAIHHHAMIKAIASEFGVVPPEEFGLAPSTLHDIQTRVS